MVTWQGDSPRPRSSATSGTRSSPAPSPGPADQEQACPGEDEALQDPGDLIAMAEAEIDAELTAPGSQPASPDPAERDRERAEERLRDQVLVQAVIEEGSGGPRHRYLENELIKYAVPVLKKLLFNGEIIGKARKLRRPAAPEDAWINFTPEDREDFAHQMVADALPGFNQAVFKDRRWTPGGGASLKTYFVNACIMQFARQQHRWFADRQAVRPVAEIDPDAVVSSSDPASIVSDRDQVRRLLAATEDEQLRHLLVLRAVGTPAKEAAQEAGLSEKAAEGRLARFIKKQREGTDPPSDAQGGR